MSLAKEISSLIKLALPVSLAQLALIGMTATDVLIAGNASTVDLAGINLGGNVWNMIVLFFMGIGTATQPLVAKKFGAKNFSGVKNQLHQSIWLTLWLGVAATVLVLLAAFLVRFIKYDQAMLNIASNYLLVIALCAIPFTMMPALRGTLEGMNLTMAVFLVNLGAFFLNIPLDYIFVNGLYGFPKMGGVGCAIASVILVWLAFFANLLMLIKQPKIKHMNLLKEFARPQIPEIRSTLKLGFPIGVSLIVELSMFCGAGFLIAAFGPIEAAAHAVALTVASISFMLYVGLGQGVTIRASQFLGANQADKAWTTVKVGTIFNVFTSVIICIAFVLFNRFFINLFSDDLEVIELAVILLYFGAAFQIVDCIQVAAICGLRAYHDTASPPKLQFIAFWLVGLPIGIWLAFSAWMPSLAGAKGLWFGMVGSLFLVSLLLLRRLFITTREYPLGLPSDEIIK